MEGMFALHCTSEKGLGLSYSKAKWHGTTANVAYIADPDEGCARAAGCAGDERVGALGVQCAHDRARFIHGTAQPPQACDIAQDALVVPV